MLDNIVLVLVEPLQPGNVGGAVRAMANTGLGRLVVVNPPSFDVERARWMAPGCDDLLDKTRFVATLDEALLGTHRAVATTARHRRYRQPVIDPDTLATEILDGPPDKVTAILFGREDFGLPRDATERCDSLVRIPTPEHASLNLAQAVLLVAWSIFSEARRRGLYAGGRTVGGGTGSKPTAVLSRKDRRDQRAELGQVEPAADELVSLLERVGYTRGTSPEKVALTVRQSLQRGDLSVRQVDALRGMFARVQWALDHPEHDWTRGKKGN